MIKQIFKVAAGLAALGAGTVVLAHHSLSGQFDVGKSFHISGKITRVDWINPHVYVYVEGKAADGSAATYKLESLPVAMMRKSGLSKQLLLGDGQPVEIDAHPARDGTRTLGYILHITYPDGREYKFAKVPGEE